MKLLDANTLTNKIEFSIAATIRENKRGGPERYRHPLLAHAGLDRAEGVVIRGTSFRTQGHNRFMEEVKTGTELP